MAQQREFWNICSVDSVNCLDVTLNIYNSSSRFQLGIRRILAQPICQTSLHTFVLLICHLLTKVLHKYLVQLNGKKSHVIQIRCKSLPNLIQKVCHQIPLEVILSNNLKILVFWRTYSAILGVHVFRSFLRNIAKSDASSLINVSTVCLCPTLIRGTSTAVSK